MSAARVALRRVEPRDLDLIFEMMRDPASVAMAAFTAADPEDRDAFDAHMERILSDPAIRHRAVLEGTRLVGTVAAFPSEGATEVTVWVARDRWGHGIATRALALLIEQVAARPLRARAASDNAASLRALTRVGFRRVATAVSFAAGRGRDVEETLLELA